MVKNGCGESYDGTQEFSLSEEWTNGIFFFLIGIHSMQGWTATTRHGVTRKKKRKKDYKLQKICLERTYS